MHSTLEGERKAITQFLKSRSYESTWYVVIKSLCFKMWNLPFNQTVTTKSSVPEHIKTSSILEAMLKAWAHSMTSLSLLLPFSIRDRATLALDVYNFLFGAHPDPREHRLLLTLNGFAWIQKNKARSSLSHNPSSFDTILHKILLPWTNAWAQWHHNMAAGIPFMEVTGRKDVQNGGRSILKMTTGFGLFSSLSKGKIYFFLLLTQI